MEDTSRDLIKYAIDVIQKEQDAVAQLKSYIDEGFARIVEIIYHNTGRVILTGIGKSAIIANKITATLNSTGTPAVFMHAADAIHGDLGIVQANDIVICLSKSGNTAEIKVLVPLIKSMGNLLIAIVSNTKSYLAEHADHVIRATVTEEACPNNLAPTASTTTQLVMGDALAVCLLKKRGFTQNDFARFHPGGSLGKKLYTRICDIMDPELKPQVAPDADIPHTIYEISHNRLGATAVIDAGNKLCGIITDGDVRRMVEKGLPIDKLQAKDIMSVHPKTIAYDQLAINGYKLMESNKITQLIVLQDGVYTGMVHLHEILREGIV